MKKSPANPDNSPDADLLAYRVALRAEEERAAHEFPDLRDAAGPRAALLTVFPSPMRAGAVADLARAARRLRPTPQESAALARGALALVRTCLKLAAAEGWPDARIHAAFARHRAESRLDGELRIAAEVGWQTV